jgi:tellurite resistance protein
MPEFFPEIEIRQDQAEAIARGLFAVARADGEVHAREAAMISEFFNATTAHAADLGALERGPRIEPASLALMLPTRDLKRLFLKTAMLLAYADGSYGPGESKAIGDFARALEIQVADLAELEAQVKDYLLSQLSHLANVEEVAKVAKDLKV